MDAPLDDRLTRLEKLLEELIERQRLSRFDTVAFLSYPVVLVGMTYLMNALLQYLTMGDVLVLGLSYKNVLPIVGVVLGVWVVAAFLGYTRAYLTDDLVARIVQSRNLVYLGGVMVLMFLSPFLSPAISELTEKAPSPVLSRALSVALALAGLTTVVSFWDEVTIRTMRRAALWFERNLPHILRTAEVSFADLPRTRRVRVWRIGLVATSITYDIALILAVQGSGSGAISVYHVGFLILVAVAAIAMIFRS
jgi:hypothetical protein